MAEPKLSVLMTVRDGERHLAAAVESVLGQSFGDFEFLIRDDGSTDSSPDLLRGFAERYFPQGTGPTMALRACIFTNTPDEHFILDHHPAHPQVVLASPCSGHGYKFCSVVGEVLADLATGDGGTRHEIGFLRLGQGGQVVALVRHHLRQADADGPNRRHQRARRLPRPAVRGPHDLLDACVRLGLGGGAAG